MSTPWDVEASLRALALRNSQKRAGRHLRVVPDPPPLDEPEAPKTPAPASKETP